MKHFIDKKYFNMVEIVLALAVVAIAIVSLMGMLPVALRASKNSVADNSVSATVEVMKSFIDKEYTAGTFTEFQNKFKDAENKYVQSDDTVIAYSDSSVKFPDDSNLQNYAFQITNGGAGAYKVEFFSGDFSDGKFAVTDFDADVRIWHDKLDSKLYIPAAVNVSDCLFEGNGTTDAANKKIGKDVGCTFYIEVSWPAGIRYANQEHRLYKFDYFSR